jgi:hypothetical protein
VFNNPLPNVSLYGYCMSTKSKVMYSVLGFCGFLKETGGYDADWLNSFATEVVERLHWLFQLLSVVEHFFNA